MNFKQLCKTKLNLTKFPYFNVKQISENIQKLKYCRKNSRTFKAFINNFIFQIQVLYEPYLNTVQS
jgi:hypothetical protein